MDKALVKHKDLVPNRALVKKAMEALTKISVPAVETSEAEVEVEVIRDGRLMAMKGMFAYSGVWSKVDGQFTSSNGYMARRYGGNSHLDFQEA